jgi:hypothetical protein
MIERGRVPFGDARRPGSGEGGRGRPGDDREVDVGPDRHRRRRRRPRRRLRPGRPDAGNRSGPAVWAEAAWRAAVDWECEAVVVEDNQGGDMVEHTLKSVWPTLDLAAKCCRHRSGGCTRWRTSGPGRRRSRRWPSRTRPRVHHVKTNGVDLGALEDELTSWDGTGDSPDRLDAMVHGLRWLLLPGEQRDQNNGKQVVAGADAQLRARPVGAAQPPRGDGRRHHPPAERADVGPDTEARRMAAYRILAPTSTTRPATTCRKRCGPAPTGCCSRTRSRSRSKPASHRRRSTASTATRGSSSSRPSRSSSVTRRSSSSRTPPSSRTTHPNEKAGAGPGGGVRGVAARLGRRRRAESRLVEQEEDSVGSVTACSSRLGRRVRPAAAAQVRRRELLPGPVRRPGRRRVPEQGALRVGRVRRRRQRVAAPAHLRPPPAAGR